MSAFDGGIFEPVVGSVYALRTFAIGDDGALMPVTHGDSRPPWVDGENIATCTAHLGGPVPDPDCFCGFYAYADPLWVEYHQRNAVQAVVECYGRMVAGTKGGRAEKARIVGLWLSQDIPSGVAERIRKRYPSATIHRSPEELLLAHPLTRLKCHVPRARVREAWFWQKVAPFLLCAVSLVALVLGVTRVPLSLWPYSWLVALAVLGRVRYLASQRQQRLISSSHASLIGLTVGSCLVSLGLAYVLTHPESTFSFSKTVGTLFSLLAGVVWGSTFVTCCYANGVGVRRVPNVHLRTHALRGLSGSTWREVEPERLDQAGNSRIQTFASDGHRLLLIQPRSPETCSTTFVLDPNACFEDIYVIVGDGPGAAVLRRGRDGDSRLTVPVPLRELGQVLGLPEGFWTPMPLRAHVAATEQSDVLSIQWQGPVPTSMSDEGYLAWSLAVRLWAQSRHDRAWAQINRAGIVPAFRPAPLPYSAPMEQVSEQGWLDLLGSVGPPESAEVLAEVGESLRHKFLLPAGVLGRRGPHRFEAWHVVEPTLAHHLLASIIIGPEASERGNMVAYAMLDNEGQALIAIHVERRVGDLGRPVIDVSAKVAPLRSEVTADVS